MSITTHSSHIAQASHERRLVVYDSTEEPQVATCMLARHIFFSIGILTQSLFQHTAHAHTHTHTRSARFSLEFGFLTPDVCSTTPTDQKQKCVGGYRPVYFSLFTPAVVYDLQKSNEEQQVPCNQVLHDTL